MSIKYMHPADQLVMFMRRIYDKGLTTTSGGNLSIMDNDGNIWITPASVDKGNLTRRDIICVHPDGTCVGPHRPSSELPFHASVYKMRPDLKAVLHAHPPALVAFSILRKTPSLDLTATVRDICPDVQIAAYDVPGSEALGARVGAVFARECDIAILENHGVCIGAADMFLAFQRFETLNSAAELEILAAKVGTANHLPARMRRITDTRHDKKLDDFIPGDFSSEELSTRRDMITLIRRSYRMGLFTSTSGTCSARLSDGSFLITPFGQDRAYMQEEDLVRVKAGMKENGKIPSRAALLHQEIYRCNPEIRTVLQARPVHAMAFTVTGAEFDPRTIPESYILLRDIRKIPCETLYTQEEKVAGMFGPSVPALMVENDCVAVTGNSLLQAFERLEVLEATAHSIINSLNLGSIVHITAEEIADLKKAFRLED